MPQPNWKCIAQIGGGDPIANDGYWIFCDTNGKHEAEGEFLIGPEDDETHYKVYRFPLTKCTFENGVLSDDALHPEIPAWFADELGEVAYCAVLSPREIRDQLCSSNVIRRATAYEAIGRYYGFINLDEYPTLLREYQVGERYASEQYIVRKGK